MTFYELENLCKRRKRKRIILILSFIVFIIGLILFFKFDLKEKQNNSEILKKEIVKKSILKPKIKKEQKNLSEKEIKYLPIIDLNIKEVNKVNNKIKNIKKKELEKNNSLIIKTNTLPSFKTCIELSKKYFKNKEYKEALKWAKFANLQDKKNPVSWIIAAKALYKMRKKEEAIKLLKIYNSYYNNKEIKNLIRKFNEN